jgi:hypothetical protein
LYAVQPLNSKSPAGRAGHTGREGSHDRAEDPTAGIKKVDRRDLSRRPMRPAGLQNVILDNCAYDTQKASFLHLVSVLSVLPQRSSVNLHFCEFLKN